MCILSDIMTILFKNQIYSKHDKIQFIYYRNYFHMIKHKIQILI